MSRRRIPNNSTTTRPTLIPTFQTQNATQNETEPIIKHFPFIQSFSQKNELVNEAILFMFTLIAASSQFVHLYRSVWWFPDSYTNYTVNFYLIDVSLVVFIFVMIGRRFLYCLLIKALEIICPEKFHAIAEKSLKFFFLGFLEVSFLICNLKIFQSYSIVYLFYLVYPIILYLVIFKSQIDPFLRINHSKTGAASYLGGQEPLHSCSNNAMEIRQEVSEMRSDFNNRFKQIIFTSVLNSYYACFIPWCFVNKHLYYSKFWVTQHLFFTWINLFTMCAVYCFPIKYCDILHRSAIHLGQWIKLGPRATHGIPQNWSKTQIFSYGSYVKYSGEVYKSISECTSAMPSDAGHHRFYALFKNPSLLYLIICAIQIATVLMQLILILYSREYQYIISIGLMLATNYYTLFKVIRDYLIVKNIYQNGS